MALVITVRRHREPMVSTGLRREVFVAVASYKRRALVVEV
jgi:hypothetical protein